MLIVGSKRIVNKLPHFHIIYQPLKRGHHNFWTSRPLEPFLVDLMQSGFCEKTLYSYLAWVPQNLFWNLLIVVKSSKICHEISQNKSGLTLHSFSKLYGALICTILVGFWVKIGMQLGFYKVYVPFKYHASIWTMEVTTASVSFQTAGLHCLYHLKP